MADRYAAQADDADIRLTLPARPENVAVVRHVLGALGEAIGLDDPVVSDIQLAVTEACTNVVRHAYAHGEGTIDVVVRPRGDTVEVVVSDEGRGLGPSPDIAGPGLGMPLIAALADSVEVQRDRKRGSRLAMRFARSRTSPAMGMA
jgi:anti-sigma regulatory factor (Ser/Thr protein kinase)